MRINKQTFQDTAGALGIQTPALIEKDYYVVQILKEINNLKFEGYNLIFTGGTCLIKTNIKLFRFSEDVDYKLSLSIEAMNESRSSQKKLKKDIYHKITNMISSSDIFNLENDLKRNEYGLQVFNVNYPSVFDCPDFIRPYIKLELFESTQFDTPDINKIHSFVHRALENEPEIDKISCSSINSIAAEKFVSLMRRTAVEIRGLDINPDKTLVRHAYDLNIILQNITNNTEIINLIPKVIDNDIEQFGNKHNEFRHNPMLEIKTALDTIITDKEFEHRYHMFLTPLVYNEEPKSWSDITKTLELIYKQLCN